MAAGAGLAAGGPLRASCRRPFGMASQDRSALAAEWCLEQVGRRRHGCVTRNPLGRNRPEPRPRVGLPFMVYEVLTLAD